MKTQSIIDLITILEEKTRAGELPWELQGDTFLNNPSSFKTTLGNFMISIRENKSVFGQDEPDYYLTIGFATGSELESLSDAEITRMATSESLPFKAFIPMESIFKNARRRVLGVDTAIDEILASLKKSP